MRPIALVLALLVAFSGCISSPGAPTPDDDAGPAPTPNGLVTTVDAAGRAVTPVPGPAGTPLFVIRDLKERAVEPTLGVTSKGTIFTHTQRPASDTPIGGSTSLPLVLKSTDLGATWTSASGPTDAFPRSFDPILHVDPITDRVFWNVLYVGCSFLSWSDDEGATWERNPAACGLPGNDHQTLGTGPARGVQTTGYPNVVYYAFNGIVDSKIARSLDGGLTFEPAVVAIGAEHCGGLNGHVASDLEGRVFLPAAGCDKPVLAVSEDSGATWEVVTIPTDKGRSTPGDDPSAAADAAGNVYFTWPGKDALMYLSVSKDHGRTWGSTLKVSPPQVTSSIFPTMVAGDAGRIAVAYYASKSPTEKWGSVNSGDATPDATWHLFVTYSLDALDEQPTFTTVQVTPDDAPIQRGRIHNGGGGDPARNLLDFFDTAVDEQGRVYVAYTDGCQGCTSDQDSRKRALSVAVLQEGPSLNASLGVLS